MTVWQDTWTWPLQPKSPELLRATCLHVPCSRGTATAAPTWSCCGNLHSGAWGIVCSTYRRASFWTATGVQIWPRQGLSTQNTGGLSPDASNHSSQSLGGAPAIGQGQCNGAPRAALRCACAGPERRAVQRLRKRCGRRGACSLLGRSYAAGRGWKESPACGWGPCWDGAAEAHRELSTKGRTGSSACYAPLSLCIIDMSASADMPAASAGAVGSCKMWSGRPSLWWCHYWQRAGNGTPAADMPTQRAWLRLR